jgi:hypothetical protein
MYLTLHENYLSGSLPNSEAVPDMPSLLYLNLGSNNLTGTIPDIPNVAPSLVAFGIYNNSINGSIPASFVNLTDLQILAVQGNYMTGAVSTSLCNVMYAAGNTGYSNDSIVGNDTELYIQDNNFRCYGWSCAKLDVFEHNDNTAICDAPTATPTARPTTLPTKAPTAKPTVIAGNPTQTPTTATIVVVQVAQVCCFYY